MMMYSQLQRMLVHVSEAVTVIVWSQEMFIDCIINASWFIGAAHCKTAGEVYVLYHYINSTAVKSIRIARLVSSVRLLVIIKELCSEPN